MLFAEALRRWWLPLLAAVLVATGASLFIATQIDESLGFDPIKFTLSRGGGVGLTIVGASLGIVWSFLAAGRSTVSHGWLLPVPALILFAAGAVMLLIAAAAEPQPAIFGWAPDEAVVSGHTYDAAGVIGFVTDAVRQLLWGGGPYTDGLPFPTAVVGVLAFVASALVALGAGRVALHRRVAR